MDALQIDPGFPGATLAVRLENRKIIHIATGFADQENQIRMKPTDRIFSGSVGKTFVAAVTMQLKDEGKLDFDEKIERYFGDESWFVRLPNHSDITIRMLLNHTSGMPRYVLKEAFWDEMRAEPDRIWAPEETVAFVLDEEPVHEAGAGWSYSDTNFILLGMIIEKVCSNTYYDELQKRILDPLRLKLTTPQLSRDIPGLVPGVTGDVPPFKLGTEVLIDGRYIVNPQFEWTGGGLVTNTRDLAVFAKVLYEGELFSQESLNSMLEPANGTYRLPVGSGYGFGVQLWETEWDLIYGHGGIFPGYQTEMIYVPKLKCSIAMHVNADRLSGKLGGSMLEFMFSFIPIIDEYFN